MLSLKDIIIKHTRVSLNGLQLMAILAWKKDIHYSDGSDDIHTPYPNVFWHSSHDFGDTEPTWIP